MRDLITLVGAAVLLLAGCDRAPPAPAPQPAAEAARVEVDPEIATFYKARGFQALWVSRKGPNPEAQQLLAALAQAEKDGLDPGAYGMPALARALEEARSGRADSLARAELLLSSAFTRYVADLHRTNRSIYYVDEELAPQSRTRTEILEAAAAAPSLPRHLAAVLSVNPLYKGLRRGLDGRPPAEARIIRANMERARLIQPPTGRYIIVDAAGAQLWLMEGTTIRERMRTIVGRKGQETPEMAGLIRFAVLNPYWNLPPDLARERVAKRVLRQGSGFIASEGLQILSDWSASARPIGPGQVNWRAVAAGTEKLRVRQLPGPSNVMGKVKFMMPNKLGIYLHDTPNKAPFATADRLLSSGCVRVEDAERLARWLFGGKAPEAGTKAPEQRVYLPEPVPVYITYLTAVPAAGGGIVFQPDVYGRDPAMLSALDGKGGRS